MIGVEKGLKILSGNAKNRSRISHSLTFSNLTSKKIWKEHHKVREIGYHEKIT
jgi:hypothetical protein